MLIIHLSGFDKLLMKAAHVKTVQWSLESKGVNKFASEVKSTLVIPSTSCFHSGKGSQNYKLKLLLESQHFTPE